MKRAEELFLGGIISFFALLRFPSLFEPHWYGDEGIYQAIGIAIRQGRILYSQIWDNKPPLLYLIYAVFNSDQFYVRLFSLLVGIGTIIVFYFLAKKLFKNLASVLLSTSFFAVMFALPVLEGNIANAENFMLLPTIAAFYLVVAASSSTPIKSRARNRFLFTFIAGILLSIAFLIKIVAIFDLVALFIILFILRFLEEMRLTLKTIHNHIKDIINGFEQETVLVAGFITPIILTVLYFLFAEALPDFLRATFSQNVGYIGYGNFLIVPMGFLYLKLALLIFSVLLIVRYKKNFGESGILILVWFFFSMFNVFFAQRPYTHYLLVMLPAFSLLVGYTVDNRKLFRLTLSLLIIVTIMVISVFRLNFKKIIPYYGNFLSFISNGKSVEAYQVFFDRNTPRDYSLASFIKSKTTDKDSIYLWSDSAQIYVLSQKLPPGRYTVSYHVTFYPDAVEETKAAIKKQKVKYIIQTKENSAIIKLLDDYELKYKIEGAAVYERRS